MNTPAKPSPGEQLIYLQELFFRLAGAVMDEGESPGDRLGAGCSVRDESPGHGRDVRICLQNWV